MATGSEAAANQVDHDGNDTDYGSDFSPEEEQIVERLLARGTDIEDNPIASQVENDAQQTLRVPRVFGREQRFLLHKSARAAESNAAQLNQTAHYPDCRHLAPFESS